MKALCVDARVPIEIPMPRCLCSEGYSEKQLSNCRETHLFACEGLVKQTAMAPMDRNDTGKACQIDRPGQGCTD